jgi:hypothetical protein
MCGILCVLLPQSVPVCCRRDRRVQVSIVRPGKPQKLRRRILLPISLVFTNAVGSTWTANDFSDSWWARFRRGARKVGFSVNCSAWVGIRFDTQLVVDGVHDPLPGAKVPVRGHHGLVSKNLPGSFCQQLLRSVPRKGVMLSIVEKNS